MIGYEKHEFSAEMAKPAPEGLLDPMALYREMLETHQPLERSTEPDLYANQVIDQVLRARRIAEREEARPIEPEAPVAARRPEPAARPKRTRDLKN